jgi:hypothetical protein
MTNGKQMQPNPYYAADKGKYGKNWMSSGSTLAIGEFIGSTNGDIALIMQSDGNLVLYTFTLYGKNMRINFNEIKAIVKDLYDKNIDRNEIQMLYLKLSTEVAKNYSEVIQILAKKNN